jgi:hypothetical protein
LIFFYTDLAILAYSSQLHHHKERLEGQDIIDVSQVLPKALARKRRVKEFISSQKSMEKSSRPIYTLM